MFLEKNNRCGCYCRFINRLITCIFFNEFAPQVFGNETFFYTAYPNGHGGYEIPFLIAMGISFAIT